MPETSAPASAGSTRIRNVIHAFIKMRLSSKLDKLAEDDPKRAERIAQYQPAAWLEDAAKRARQLQVVTHALKPIHPHADGTNLYVSPEQLPSRSELGSHVLGNNFSYDVVGNAGALDVYEFLKLEIDGRSLLNALLAKDADALHALDDDAAKARQLRDAFVAVTQSDGNQPASHPLAKQLYWLVGVDPTDDTAYHLLAPLHATSLAHAIYNAIHNVIQEDRSDAANKAARRDNHLHDGVLPDYRNLAVQKLGGSKPWNISQLNHERHGENYLLSCMPPTWKSQALRNPYQVTSIFNHIYGACPEVGKTISDLRHFLEHDPRPIMETRNQRDAYIDTLIDELVQLAFRYQQELPAGWSLDARTDLHKDECLWLDPYRAEIPEEIEFRTEWLTMAWVEEIGKRFARWVNSKLEYRLPVGDVEFRHWKKELLHDERLNGWARRLHQQRQELEASSVKMALEANA